jgi:hypothetical protein
MRLLSVAAGLLVLGSSAQAACLKAETDGQIAEGKLASVVVSVPDYKLKEQAYILTLSTPACLDGTDEYDKVESSTRVHVFSMDDALRRRLRAFVGRTVRVHGSAFGEMTAHHHAPIVMQVTAIESLRQ